VHKSGLVTLRGRFLSSGKMKNAKMKFILAFFISTFATLSYCLFCDRVILSRRHDSKLSLSQHRAYLLAVDALGVLDVRQPCAGHYVVEATYVATERIEESTSHEVSPNVDEVLASGVSSSKLADTNDAHGCFGRRVRGVHYACHGYRRRSPGPRRFFSTGAQGPALFY